MEIRKTPLEDCWIIENQIFGDDRGFFLESFNKKRFLEETGMEFEVSQINFARSKKNVFRGLHYQLNPFAQAKLVGVIQGAVLDVFVDLRKHSKTFGENFSYLLDHQSKQLFIPRGFAHGYEVLEDDTIFYYAVDNYYSPEYERGINYGDPALGIKLKNSKNTISEKDMNHPKLIDAEHNF